MGAVFDYIYCAFVSTAKILGGFVLLPIPAVAPNSLDLGGIFSELPPIPSHAVVVAPNSSRFGTLLKELGAQFPVTVARDL
ncbi:hypothetical protein R3P38DRAFT_3243224 [Favolaschia claudopus]|uniref:Uncharacterized protein n=1 Tax=Favolaschia claudopus TaxID=2862362 RepID=A0AAV9Z390_9AGAR